MKLSKDDFLDPFIRHAALEALSILVGRGVITREKLLDVIQDLLKQPFHEKEPCPLFNAMVVFTCCELWPDKLLEDIKNLYAYNLIETEYIDIHEVISYFDKGMEECLKELEEKTSKPIYAIIAKYGKIPARDLIGRFIELEKQKNAVLRQYDHALHSLRQLRKIKMNSPHAQALKDAITNDYLRNDYHNTQ